MTSRIKINFFNICFLTVIALFACFLFKAGADSGQFVWLIRPQYVLKSLLGITMLSLLVVAVFFYFLIVMFFKLRISQDFFILNLLFVILSAVVQFGDALHGASLGGALSRVFIVLTVSVIFTYFFSIGLTYKSNKFHAQVLSPLRFVCGAFIIVNFVLFFVDNAAVIADFGRMYGITQHPNFLGVNSALSSLVFLQSFHCSLSKYNSLNSSNVDRIISVVLVLLGLFLIVMSGSRTGMVVFATGFFISIILIRKPYKYLIYLVLLVVAACIYVYWQNYVLENNDMRILSSENTRAEAWNSLLSEFLSSPFVGVGLSNVTFSENSMLRMLAASGVVGGVFFLLVYLLGMYWTAKSLFKSNQLLMFSIPLFVGLFFGSLLEGYLIDSLSFPVLLFQYVFNLIFTGMISSVVVSKRFSLFEHSRNSASLI